MAKIIICKECGEEKELKAHGLCAACYERKWREDNRERVRECERNRKKRDQRDYYLEYNMKTENEVRGYERMLHNKYGITLTEYDEMLESQGNGCWICGISPEENGKRLFVDHNHETGEVRGLLCTYCNSLLGFAKDNPQVLARAIEYLLKEE